MIKSVWQKKGIKIFLTCLMVYLPVQAHGADVEKILDTTKVWDGRPIPPQKIARPKITALRITIKPGEKLPIHKHPVLNIGYLIQGTLTVTKPNTGQSKTLQAGDGLVELIGQWHRGENRGKTDAVIVVFYIGKKGQPLTILKKP